MTGYRTDNFDPPDDNNGFGSWTQQLSPYLSVEWRDTLKRFPTDGPAVWYCPEAELQEFTIGAAGNEPFSPLRNVSHGYNYRMAYPARSMIRYEMLNEPGSMLTFADLWRANTQTPVSGFGTGDKPWDNSPGIYHRENSHAGASWGGAYGTWAWRHQDRLNMAHFDGHVAVKERRTLDHRPSGFRFSDVA